MKHKKYDNITVFMLKISNFYVDYLYVLKYWAQQ